ncbi:HpcH/HpaI aldolase family protein [Bacillus sp. REN16]|uniref:HpcH/HpaI aldolase family protein n=1 Tax=Bacillus sp. REN16 TaxID=2887296 RepID=UPI001E2B0F96|nr:aldolase/citrate lyase family protein [Bacillus sp. REN16]MCC3359461.1 hypothetical protein [Bacillus sp. REN16]
MTMNANLREKLQKGETAFGLWVTSEEPAVTEVAALLGIDWICVDLEHGYIDYKSVAGHLTAAKESDMSVFVRPPSQDLEPIKRALDMGAHGIILPLVDSAEEIRQAYQHFYYPPLGRRGLGGERSGKWGLGLGEYVSSANDELMFVPMIETQKSYDNLDEILNENVETIFLGPGDLSASRGAVGEWEGPGVAEMNLDILRRAKDRGISSGIVARSTDEAILRRDQGFGMVSLGSDIGLMIRQIRSMAEALGKTSVGHRWF